MVLIFIAIAVAAVDILHLSFRKGRFTTREFIVLNLPVFAFLIAVAFYLKTYDSAMIKITLLQDCATIIITVWLIRVIKSGGAYLRFFKQPILLPVWAFLFWGILSFILSKYKGISTIDFFRRVLYTGIFLAIFFEFSRLEHYWRMVRLLIAAALISSLYGLIQYTGQDPFIWKGAFGTRVFSTFGNPNFYGGFLVFVAPLILMIMLKKRSKFMGLIFILLVFNVVVTQSKGAYIGLAASVSFFVLFAVLYLMNLERKKAIRISVIFCVVIILFAASGVGYYLLRRIDSVRFRIFTWLSTVQMIQEASHGPMLGEGIGTFRVVYPVYRRPEIFLIEGKHNTMTEHPEDEYLGIGFEEGLIGLSLFLWLITTFFTAGIRRVRYFDGLRTQKLQGKVMEQLKDRQFLLVGFMAGLFGLLAHNTVDVSLRFVSSGSFLWIYLGIIGSIISPAKTEDASEQKIDYGINTKLACFAVLLSGVYCIFVFTGYFFADLNHNKAIAYSKGKVWEKALEHYGKVVRYNPYFVMAHYFMGNVYNDRWLQNDFEKALKKYDDVKYLAPNYVQVHFQVGNLYLKMGQDLIKKGLKDDAKGYMDQAIVNFRKALDLDPVFPQNYFSLAWAFVQMKDWVRAEEVYGEAITNTRKYVQTQMDVGRVYIKLGRWIEAARAYRQALDRYKRAVPMCNNLGNVYLLQKKKKEAERTYKKAIFINNDNLASWRSLGAFYLEEKNYKAAYRAWKRVLSLDPKHKEALAVVRSLSEKIR